MSCVLRFGLNTILNPDEHKEFVKHIIRARNNFQDNFGTDLNEYVEFFNEEKYLFHSSIAENLTFGSPNNEMFSEGNLLTNPKFLDFLDEADLNRPLLALGAELTQHTVDILGNLPPEPVFFEQSPIFPEELDFFKDLSNRLQKTKLHQLLIEDKEKLMALALRYTPGRHKMISFPSMLEKLILEGRSLFREQINKTESESFTFYSVAEYIASQTILNNIFFGNITSTAPQVQDKINQCIMQLLIEEDLLDTVLALGMKFNVGSKGENLSGGQRQKLAIARAFLKNPKFLIMDESTSALDNKSQARIQNLLETRLKGKSTLIAVVHRLDIIKGYDKVAVMKAGKIMEFGPYDQLYAQKGMLYELVSGKK
jgi:ABC-type transport system involved in cytochrome bd biosynthesis fused ATPase/permease subunit